MATATIGLSTPLSAPAKAPASAPRKGMFMRLMEAMMVARLRQAERELSMYRHLFPEGKVGPLPDPVPHDEVKQAGYKATYADAGLLPFVR